MALVMAQHRHVLGAAVESEGHIRRRRGHDAVDVATPEVGVKPLDQGDIRVALREREVGRSHGNPPPFDGSEATGRRADPPEEDSLSEKIWGMTEKLCFAGKNGCSYPVNGIQA